MKLFRGQDKLSPFRNIRIMNPHVSGFPVRVQHHAALRRITERRHVANSNPWASIHRIFPFGRRGAYLHPRCKKAKRSQKIQAHNRSYGNLLVGGKVALNAIGKEQAEDTGLSAFCQSVPLDPLLLTRYSRNA